MRAAKVRVSEGNNGKGKQGQEQEEARKRPSKCKSEARVSSNYSPLHFIIIFYDFFLRVIAPLLVV